VINSSFNTWHSQPIPKEPASAGFFIGQTIGEAVRAILMAAIAAGVRSHQSPRRTAFYSHAVLCRFAQKSVRHFDVLETMGLP
jgi:hypothetical protein